MTKVSRRDVLLGSLLLAGTAVTAAAAVPACRRDGTEPPDRGKILSDLSTTVIVPAYVTVADEAKSLEASVIALRDRPPQAEALVAARAAWKKARKSWKLTNAFLFGPADDLALTGGIIDEAPDVAKIEETLSAANDPDVQKLGANQRGFGGLEALLFDPTKDDAAMAAAFQATPRRGVLAALVAIDLRTKIEKVRDAWSSNYGSELARAGRGSAVYASERQGVDAIVNALIAGAEVLIAVRLAKPLGIDKTPATPAPNLVESQRSDASVDDILAVLDGIESVYTPKAGLQLAAAVAERSPAADEHLRANLKKAKEATTKITTPLRTAITDSQRDIVIAAHAAIREVKRTLTSEIAAALGTSVGFNVTDGD
jgi:uncharacterized protein